MCGVFGVKGDLIEDATRVADEVDANANTVLRFDQCPILLQHPYDLDPTAYQLAAHDEAALGEVDLLANLQHFIPARTA